MDALLDALQTLPFLFAAFFLMEFMEHRANERMRERLTRVGKLGPLVGALFGIIPQCGFSVAAANFYAGRVITMGTLLAVFLSTSDQALLVLLAHPQMLDSILPLLLTKLLSAVVFGFLLDLLLQGRRKDETPFEDLCADCDCEHTGIWRAALHHTVRIFLFILAVNLLLGYAIELLGAERVSAFLLSGSVFQPFLAAFVGLIPNCAVSVLFAELFLSGTLRFGALAAGLCSGAGVGLIVLFRSNRHLKENLFFLAVLYISAALTGVFLDFLF